MTFDKLDSWKWEGIWTWTNLIQGQRFKEGAHTSSQDNQKVPTLVSIRKRRKKSWMGKSI